ncbi:MAG: hypothetical protein LBH90_05105 [Tannerella sp.]|jgi:hypothetical protein|nr:hypothetical protein [Tannerella sp.]
MTKVYSHVAVRRFVLISIMLFGVIAESVLYFGFPEYYTKYTLFIPVYFLLLGVSLLLSISRIRTKQLHLGRALARLMLLNVVQLFLSFGVLFYYIRYIHEQRRVFVLLFGLYYIMFFGLKMFVFYNIDSDYREKKKLKN